MSEEEKQAIDILKTFEFRRITKNYNKLSLEDSQSVEIVLNYIDKLQKENEELKVDNKKLNDLLMFSELDYVSKDKIRDKIKELEDIKNKNIEHCSIDYFRLSRAINILKELLGGE